jgi:hypothetical protein
VYEPPSSRAQGVPYGTLRNLHCAVSPTVEVGVGGGLDNSTTVLLGIRNGIPLLLLIPVELPSGIERPVAVAGDNRLDGGNLVVGEEHPRVNDIGFLVSGSYQLRERCALSRVVETAIEVDSNRLGQNTSLDVHSRIILRIAHIAAQSGHIRESGGLCLNFPEN